MKRLGIFLLILIVGITTVKAQTNTQKIEELFSNVLDFTDAKINDSRPISNINYIASQQADTMFFLKKENVGKVMTEAKKYKSCIIVVENHTAVLVKSWSNCSKSGSWNYCMPFGEGYIQRVELVKKEDYIKNIIGIPDHQRRTVFLFNKK